MSTAFSLKDRHADTTQRLILSTAVELLEREGVNATTARAVAKEAGISERTIFRYYASRDEFLDAIAEEAISRMQTPPPPDSIKDLLDYADPLYRRFEEWAPLLNAALHSDISKRVRANVAEIRWKAIAVLIDREFPKARKRERKIAATNISYYLSASSWHYYRTQFGLSLGDTIECARAAIRSAVRDLGGKN
jgi:AcrR family transcriptional regulator